MSATVADVVVRLVALALLPVVAPWLAWLGVRAFRRGLGATVALLDVARGGRE